MYKMVNKGKKQNGNNPIYQQKLKLIAGICVILLIALLLSISLINRRDKVKLNDVKFNDTGVKQITSKVSRNVQDSTGVQVPVPYGYVASPITEGFNNPAGILTSDGGENTVNTGFVIYEKLDGETDEQALASISADPWTAQCTRNQWVWIPVPDSSTIYGTDSNGKKWGKQYDFLSYLSEPRRRYWSERDGVITVDSLREPDVISGNEYDDNSSHLGIVGASSKSEFLEQLENEFNQSIESVEKYGGFYISRYETSRYDENQRLKTMKLGKLVTNNNDWWKMYQACKELSGDKTNIITLMQYRCYRHRVYTWLIETGNKTCPDINNPTTWRKFRGYYIYIYRL